MFKRLTLIGICLVFVGLGQIASAHKYFFGISDIHLNETNNHLEIIHQYTLHDLELLLKSTLDDSTYNSSAGFENSLKEYVNKQFKIYSDDELLTAEWLGFEINFGQVIIYQEVIESFNKEKLSINNRLMIDFFPEQVNTVNFSVGNSKGSLTFDKKIQNLNIPFK